MKGYFSQLARHTGLHFTNAGRSKTAASTTTHSKPHAFGDQNVSPTSPLHVEELTLVPPTPTAGGLLTSAEPASIPPATDNIRTAQTIETAPTAQTVHTPHTAQTEVLSSSPEAFSANVHVSSRPGDTRQGSVPQVDDKNVPRLSTEHQSPLTGRNIERNQVSAEPTDNHLQVDRVVTSAAPTQDDQPRADSPVEAVNDLAPRNPVEREILVRQYLREVRAWVDAPPTPIPDVPEKEVTQESQLTSKWQPESISTFNAEHEREALQAAAQATQLDVQETSLSIGSISVVIEDPGPAATTIAPTPSAPKTQPQTTQPEPISLSRYYLQRW